MAIFALLPSSNKDRIERVDVAPVALVERLREVCPGLARRDGPLGLVLHLLLTETVEPPGRTAPCTYRVLCEIAGYAAHQIEHRNARANEFVAAVRDALAEGGGMSITVTEAKGRAGLARRLRLDGVSSDVAAIAEDARNTIRFDPAEWCEVRPEGGRALNATAAARRTQEILNTLPSYDNTVPLTESLLGYLNGHDPRSFSKLRQIAGDDETQRLVAELYPAPGDYQRVAAILRSVQWHQKPIYGPAPETTRVHARGRNATGLPSPVRQDLTRRLGWAELDLAHAQLACNARRWGVDEVLDRFSAGEFSFWDDLVEHLGADPVALRRRGRFAEFKSYLKAPVHGLSFGMGRQRIERFGVEKGKAPGESLVELVESSTGHSLEEAGKRLLTHPVLGAMLESRSRIRRQIREASGWTDVFGRCHELWIHPKRPWVDNSASLLAIDAQAMELLMLQPVIELAIAERAEAQERGQQPSFLIVLWQHDGFTIKARQRSRTASVVRKLQRIVARNAKELGIPTGLTVDVPPPGWPGG